MADTVLAIEQTQTFHRFGDLPYDLRFQIWKDAVLEVERTFETRDIWWPWIKPFPALPTPSAARACSEARQVAHIATSINSDGCKMTDQVKSRLRFLLPWDILYIPWALEWSYFQSKTLSQVFQQRRHIAVHWNLEAFEQREKEHPAYHITRLGDFIHQWAFLADSKRMDTLMVNLTGHRDTIFTSPGKFEFIGSPISDTIAPKYGRIDSFSIWRPLHTVEIFDQAVDELASTTRMLDHRNYRELRFGSSLFASFCATHLKDVLELRDKWKDIEPIIKKTWVGICKYRVLMKPERDGPDRKALELATSPEHNQSWTRRIRETAPTFKAVFTHSSAVWPLLAREVAFIIKAESQTKPSTASDAHAAACVDGIEGNRFMLADMARLVALRQRLAKNSSETANIEQHVGECPDDNPEALGTGR